MTLQNPRLTIEVEHTVRAIVDTSVLDGENAFEQIASQLIQYFRFGRFVRSGSGEPAITDPDFAQFVRVQVRRRNRWVPLRGSK